MSLLVFAKNMYTVYIPYFYYTLTLPAFAKSSNINLFKKKNACLAPGSSPFGPIINLQSTSFL